MRRGASVPQSRVSSTIVPQMRGCVIGRRKFFRRTRQFKFALVLGAIQIIEGRIRHLRVPMSGKVVQLFVASAGDAPDEYRCLEFVVERLNAQFDDLLRIEIIRGSPHYASKTAFKRSLSKVASSDLFVAVFRTHLGPPQNTAFSDTKEGKAFWSGAAYHLSNAIAAHRRMNGSPSIYVFRNIQQSALPANAQDRAMHTLQGRRLNAFLKVQARPKSGDRIVEFYTHASVTEFESKLDAALRQQMLRMGSELAGWDHAVHGLSVHGCVATHDQS